MPQPIRLALIGAGIMGRHHLAVARGLPDFEIVGVADPTPAVRQKLEAEGLATFADHRAMLDSAKPDAVIVATPNAHHVPATLDCLAHGAAVLVEKPVADNMSAAMALVTAQETSGVPVLVGHHRRHNPLLIAAQKHIESGGIGSIVAAVGLWLRRKPDAYFADRWKLDTAAGGGVLLINAIHDFDCLRVLCGDIDSIQAMVSTHARGNPVEDTAAIAIRFANGALGTITISDATVAPWCWEMTSQEDPRFAHLPENNYLICGTTGSLAIPTLEHISNTPNGDRDATFIRRRLYHVAADSMTEQIKHFARVARREEAPRVTVADAARTLAATLAVRTSAESGREVRVADMLK